jgi:hypothetical protein
MDNHATTARSIAGNGSKVHDPKVRDINGRLPARRRASSRRHFRNGQRAAVVRATTGARLYLEKQVPTLAVAAEACGSNVHYIRAAVDLLKADDPSPLNLAMAGWVSLTGAADQERRRLKAPRVSVDEAVASWRVWTPAQRAEFGRGAGISEIWDCAISPVISEERVAAE